MDIYRKHYQDKAAYGISRTRKRKMLELIGDVKDKKILDIGCGSGILGQELKALGAKEVAGADISQAAIAEAAKVLDKVTVADAQTEKLPWPDRYFDIIVIAETLEHVLYPENVLAEAKRLLKDDGFIIVTTPNFLIFSNRLRMLMGRFNYTEDGFLDRGHVHFFTYPSLLCLLKNTGFELAGENHTIHDRVPEWLGCKFPSIFSFQIIIKTRKL